MPNHAARALIDEAPGPKDGERKVTLELNCGCRITRVVPADRIAETPHGRLPMGDFRCPHGHPVGYRPPKRD